MSYVQIKHLSKNFADNTVFDDINFEINQGEFIALLGPSGCGKSTLLRSIAGLTPIDCGSVVVDGQDITQLAVQKREIGMVFQSYALFPNMNVAENIAFGLKMKKMALSERQHAVDHAIALVALQGREQHYPHQLSGGQQQRVALARALVVRPRLLMLDEPLSALDAKIRKRLRQQIREIQQELNLTTLFVTHDQEEAMVMSDRIFLMNQGKIVQSGTPEEIYTHPVSEFVAGFMGNFNVIDGRYAKEWFGISTQQKVAIRPESIYIREHSRRYGDGISSPLRAQINTSQLLGNVVRYFVTLNQQQLIVDRLNRSSEVLYANGTEIELLFNTHEIQPLGN